MGPLGELERHVMDAVWDQPPATVREVADRKRGDADRGYTTVMTTLDRLHRHDDDHVYDPPVAGEHVHPHVHAARTHRHAHGEDLHHRHHG